MSSSGATDLHNPSSWFCPFCGDADGRLPIPTNVWSCPLCHAVRCLTCTVVHRPTRRSCSVCGAGIPAADPAPDHPKTQELRPWACRLCTFSNKHDAATCEMCGDRKPTAKSPLNASQPHVPVAVPAPQSSRSAACTNEAHEVVAPASDIDSSLAVLVERTRSILRPARETFADFLSAREMHGLQWASFLKGARVFPPGGASSCDIKQGGLNNCWFMSVVSVLAHRHPKLIESLFIVKDVNPEGVFAVKLWKDGVWWGTLIDAHFPAQFGWLGAPQFYYSSCKDKTSLWVPLLEKAYAKLHGSYHALEAGNCEDAFYDLTGMPCTTLRTMPRDHSSGQFSQWNEEEAFVTLHSFCTANCAMGASCGGMPEQDTYAASLRLPAHHAFSVLDVAVCQSSKRRMILLRNPWGTSEYAGVAPPVGYTAQHGTPATTGVFWMNFSEFARCFSQVTVCRTRPVAFQLAVQHLRTHTPFFIPPTSQLRQLGFRVTQRSEVHAMLVQTDLRHSSSAAYFDTMAMLVRLNRSQAVLVPQYASCSSSECARVVTLESMLEPGTYLLMPFSLQCFADFAVCLLSESSSIHPMDPSETRELADCLPLNRLLYCAARAHPRTEVKDYGGFCVVLARFGTLDVLFGVNETANSVVSTTSDFSGTCGMYLLDPSPTVACELPPRTAKALQVGSVRCHNGNHSYAFAHRMQMMIQQQPTGFIAQLLLPSRETPTCNFGCEPLALFGL